MTATCQRNRIAGRNHLPLPRLDKKNNSFHQIGFIKSTAAIILITAVLTAFPLRTLIAHEMEGDRPDFTESALTIPERHVQFEGGYTFTHDPHLMEHALGELLIRWGAFSWAELRFGINSVLWSVTDDETFWGKDDMSLGIKFQLASSPSTGSPVPDIALIVYSLLPTGSGIYREPLAQPGGKLCIAWGILDWLSFGLNAGYAYASTDRERYHAASFSAVLGFSLTQRLGCYAEYYGLYPESAGEANAHYVNAGITFLAVEEHLQLDIRAGLRMDKPEYYAGAGFIGRISY